VLTIVMVETQAIVHDFVLLNHGFVSIW
jgi:hypothetical protein